MGRDNLISVIRESNHRIVHRMKFLQKTWKVKSIVISGPYGRIVTNVGKKDANNRKKFAN